MKKLFIVWTIMIACIFTVSYVLFHQSAQTLKEQEVIQLKDTIQRAALQCYALEGRYPHSLEELINHNSLDLRFDQYSIFYTSNGDNLLPDIEVVRKK